MSLDDIAKFYVDDQNVEVEEINDDKEVTKYTTRDTKSRKSTRKRKGLNPDENESLLVLLSFVL